MFLLIVRHSPRPVRWSTEKTNECCTYTHIHIIANDPSLSIVREDTVHQSNAEIMMVAGGLFVFCMLILSLHSTASAFTLGAPRQATLARTSSTDLAMGLTLYGSQGSRYVM